MELWKYQLEIVAAVVVLASGLVSTLILDYLLNHNLVVRQHFQNGRRGR